MEVKRRVAACWYCLFLILVKNTSAKKGNTIMAIRRVVNTAKVPKRAMNKCCLMDECPVRCRLMAPRKKAKATRSMRPLCAFWRKITSKASKMVMRYKVVDRHPSFFIIREKRNMETIAPNKLANRKLKRPKPKVFVMSPVSKK